MLRGFSSVKLGVMIMLLNDDEPRRQWHSCCWESEASTGFELYRCQSQENFSLLWNKNRLVLFYSKLPLKQSVSMIRADYTLAICSWLIPRWLSLIRRLYMLHSILSSLKSSTNNNKYDVHLHETNKQWFDFDGILKSNVINTLLQPMFL